MKFLKSVVRITWENNDPPEIIRFAKEAKQKLGVDNVNFKNKFNFKKPNTGIAFLIVKDMLLTGFDAPIEQVLYIDKKMTDHTLLQAIARVNRVTRGKDVGYVVDYYGVTNHLKEALRAYSPEDLKIPDVLTDVKKELTILKKRYKQVIKIFQDHGVAGIEDFVNYRIKGTKKQMIVLEKTLDVLEDIKTRADFHTKFRLFLRSMDILLTKPIAKPYIPPLKAFSHIHNRALHRFRDPSINILGAGKKVRKVIDKYLISIGIDTKIKPIDVISDEFLKDIKKHGGSRSQASQMAHAIRRHCTISFNSDPVYYKKISEKLEEILKKVKENWDEQIDEMKKLRKELREGRKKQKSGLDPKHGPFYDLLIDIVYEKKKPSKQDEIKIKEAVINIVGMIAIEIQKIGFWDNPYKIKKLKAMIDDVLIGSRIPEVYNKKEKIVTDLTKLARNRTKEILA